MLRIRKALELIMPYIMSNQCNQENGMMQRTNTRIKQPKEYPYMQMS